MINENTTHLVVLRYRENIDVSDRLIHKDRIYEISGIRNEEERGRYLFVDAVETGERLDPGIPIDSCTHAHTADSPILVYSPMMAPEDATHGHTATEPVILAEVMVKPADASHGHTAGEPILVINPLMLPDAANLAGAISGRALYDGRIDGAEALALLGTIRGV